MRSGRRRLSVGAVGGYPAASPGGSSPRSPTFAALSRHSDCKPGAQPPLARRLSARPQMLQDSAPQPVFGSAAMRKPAADDARADPARAGPPTPAASPAIGPASPGSPLPASDGRIPATEAGASLQSAGRLGSEPTPPASVTPAADSRPWLATGNVANALAVRASDRGMPSPLEDVDMDAEGSYCSDEEDARNDPLPTPEQLIFSQTWSTWPTPCHHLYSGSEFSGAQSNGTRSYVVSVALKYVDMGVPELCGHFTIRGLTPDLPMLTTYFDAQIVGSGPNSFVTNQWDASVDTDRTHWSFFPAFMQYRTRFDCKDFRYKLSLSDKYVFMRWKERFVVPNYKLSRINGASYDGFYYVCYDRETASITGYYYHRDSDHYQCLKLKHDKQTSFSHYELA
ncbi:GID complex subunit 4, VID24 [Coemansia sp. RSA 1286]|nr:GID complex subunit 4, VID24 [Coemansia sp. RSA 485]KAJ2600459.1 GID complex subunit 4, VID24 [Coemansia sp. RSA 1721]KAJ2638987.1 GID complex subunit 4, VID24 [Coemansia sp. RSA 1286]